MVIARRKRRGRAPPQLTVRERHVFPCEARLGEDHASLEKLTVVAHHERKGHDVEHLVGEHHAADLLGDGIDPHEALEIVRKARCDVRALALAKVGTYLEQQVAEGRGIECLQLAEEVRGERPGSGSQLQDVAARGIEQLPRLHGEALREHG